MSLIHDMVTGKECKYMQVKLIGVQPIKFSNSNGETINGINLYCAFKDENVDGLRTEKFFIKNTIKLPDCKLNETLELQFNMKGKVEMVTKN